MRKVAADERFRNEVEKVLKDEYRRCKVGKCER